MSIVGRKPQVVHVTIGEIIGIETSRVIEVNDSIPIPSIDFVDMPSFVDGKVCLDFSRNCFIYGTNGTGKSTVSKGLRNQAADENGCEVYLFNQEFIDDLIDPDLTIEGVYRVRDGDPETQHRLKELEGESGEIEAKRKTLNARAASRKQLLTKIDDAKSYFIDRCWEAKGRVPLSLQNLAFRGLKNSKSKFADRCISRSRSTSNEETQTKTFEELAKELDKIESTPDGSSIPLISMQYQPLSLSEVEFEALQQPYGAKAANKLKKLIDTLDNTDWVHKGVEFLDHSNGVCPFCQTSLDDETIDLLYELFDESFENAKTTLETLSKKVRLLQDYLSATLADLGGLKDIDTSSLKSSVAEHSTYLAQIDKLVVEKLQDMGQQKSLPGEVPQSWDRPLQDINKAIESSNRDLRDKGGAKTRISEAVWSRIVWNEILSDIKTYEESIKGPNKAIAKIDEQISKISGELKELLDELDTLRSRLTSTRDVMSEVNKTLNSIGFFNFRLEAAGDEDEFYQILRDDGSIAGHTLSEGEKTLVSFLYFYHRACDLSGQVGAESELCLVIDDPISSLDSETMLAISWLCRNLLERSNSEHGRLRQVVLLTHNAQFFREVTYESRRSDGSSKRNYFVFRKQEDGKVRPVKHEKNPIDSTYNFLWREIRAAEDDESIEVGASLQNDMRRILETYFGIVGGINGKIIQRFDVSEQLAVKALLSWVNDGSHIVPWEIDYSPTMSNSRMYLRVFEKIFRELRQGEHYDLMMGRVDAWTQEEAS